MRELLKELRDNEISVSLDGDNIKLKYDHDVLPGDLVGKIKANKIALIAYLKESSNGDKGLSISPVPLSAEGYELSSSQKRLWVLSQFEEGLASYNITQQVTLNGHYNIELFSKAVTAVFERHEILRTFFRKTKEGNIKQWILPADHVILPMDHKDFTGEGDPQKAVNEYIKKDSLTGFDLEKAPLLRIALLQTAREQYVFYCTMHHIIADGWSLGVMAKDVMAFYKAFKKGTSPDLPELAIQYKDYAAWQLNELASTRNDTHKAYWTNLLKGELPVIDLPSKKSRPPVKTQSGYTLETYIPAQVTSDLKAFTKSQGGSLFMTLLSLWNIVVSRYTQQKEVIIGTPVAGRNHTDLENQIGVYINTIVLRNQIHEDETFTQHYSHVRSNTLEALSHQIYPFDKLLDDLNPKRDMSRSAVFDVLIALQNTGEKINAVDDDIEPGVIIDKGEALSKQDIEINFAEMGACLLFNVNYNPDVYDRSMISALMSHFIELAHEAMKHPDSKIGELKLLSPEEEAKVLCISRGEELNYGSSETIVELFVEQASKTPEAVAIEFEDKCVSYAELDRLSNQLANYLISEHGVEANNFVGVKLYRSEWMLVAILGILKSGAAYVPVDPDYPEERINYIKEDSAYKTCVDQELLGHFKVTAESYSEGNPNVDIQLSYNAYAIYTSGSTGMPKGVINHHAGIKNRLLWMRDYLNADQSSVFLQKTPYTFDVSVWELLLPAISGSRLVFAKPDGHKDPYYLQSIIDDKKVNIMHFVPSMLKAFLATLDPSKCESLHHVVCSGEALPSGVVNTFKNKLKCKIHNLYGPTEAAIDVTAIELSEDVKEINIGFPIANTNIYIANDYLTLQPVDIPGEIYIGGVQVARGYLNKPEMNQARFIQSPFKEGEILYKTGDVAKWNSDGTINYLGRNDDQVKIRGFRIETGEIEAQLLLKPDIKEAVVNTYKKGDLDQELVAYVISDERQNTASLRRFLTDKLPEYAVPSYFVQVGEFPLTTNGKIDKKLLPSPEANILDIGTTYVAPRNEEEEIIREMFASELGRKPEEIGVDDNFFDLGANSIRLLKILEMINQRFNVKIEPVLLFQYPNISDLVENALSGGTLETGSEEDDEISEEIDSMIDLMDDE